MEDSRWFSWLYITEIFKNVQANKMHPCQNEPDDSLLPGGGSLRSEMEAYPNTHKQNPCQSLCSVCGGLIGHSRGLDGGGAKRREHGWPPLYQSDNSSSTQTKLTCRCTGHVQLCVEINHIGSEVGTCQLHWMHHPSLRSPRMERRVRLPGLLPHTQQIEQLIKLHMQTIMWKACFCILYYMLWLCQLYIYFDADVG